MNDKPNTEALLAAAFAEAVAGSAVCGPVNRDRLRELIGRYLGSTRQDHSHG